MALRPYCISALCLSAALLTACGAEPLLTAAVEATDSGRTLALTLHNRSVFENIEYNLCGAVIERLQDGSWTAVDRAYACSSPDGSECLCIAVAHSLPPASQETYRSPLSEAITPGIYRASHHVVIGEERVSVEADFEVAP